MKFDLRLTWCSELIVDQLCFVFHAFRSPITWSAISWSSVNWAYFMPIWLADSDLNLRCCANGHALCVDSIGSKRRHGNDINNTVHIVCCQKYVLSQINTGAFIYFISLQNTMHSINWWVVIDRHAWNFILMRELSFLPAKWSDVSGANKQRTADRHV